jgi:hypothetical protein
MAALECKVAMVISRLVKFELLLELKFKQKSGTSLYTTRCKDATSFKTVERLSVPVIYFDITPWFERDLAKHDFAREFTSFQVTSLLFFCLQ